MITGIINIDRIADINKYEFGVWGAFFIIDDDIFIILDIMPCPLIFSNHAWSTNFKYLCPIFIGCIMINWVDSGTKNHMVHDA